MQSCKNRGGVRARHGFGDASIG